MFIKLKKLKFKALRSFVDEQEIDLPERGLLGIIGLNRDTNGSSGAGKSNLHLSISNAFGYCPIPGTALQSWLTDTKFSNQVTFEVPKGTATVRRGSKTSIDIDGQEFEGGKVTESKISELIPIPLDVLELLTLRSQKSHGSFLSLPDGEKKEFLSKVLSLKTFEAQIDNSNKKITELEKYIATTEGTLRALGDVMPILPPPKPKDIAPLIKRSKELKDLVKEKKELLDSKDIVLKEYKAVFKRLESLSAEKLIEGDQELQKIEAEILDLRLKRNEINTNDLDTKKLDLLANIRDKQPKVNKLGSIQTQIKATQSLIDGILNSKCPTCLQDWVAEKEKLSSAQTSLSELKAEEAQALAFAKEIAQNTTDISKIEKEIDKVHTQIVQAATNIALAEQKRDDYVKNVKREQTAKAEKELKPFLEQFMAIKNELGSLTEQYNSSIKDIDHAEEMNATNEVYYKRQVQAQEAANGKIENNQAQLKRLKELYTQELDFLLLVKSFLGGIFDEILQEVSYETNLMLEKLPNTANTTISFITEVASQKGTLRSEIKPVLYKNGLEISLKTGVSGGQETSVELAVDLAIGKVVSRRIGVMPGWLILDESFDGHDVPCKEACLELLKQAAEDRLIIIIDHASEVKEYFDHCIVIESKNDISTIKEIL